jgi:hypothetical protein
MITTGRVAEAREDMVVIGKGEVKAVERVAMADRAEGDMVDKAEDMGVKVHATSLRELSDYPCREQ